MPKNIATAAMLFFSLFSVLAANAQRNITTVDKIRYCRTIWPICNDKLQGDYHWWESSGVPDQIQKNTYISRYNEPAASRVEHVVLIASGQRSGDLSWNRLTGQESTRAFRKQESHRDLRVSEQSLAFRLFRDGVYDTGNTFAALAFDARFNWGFSKNNKNDIVNAYFNWLKSKFRAGNLRSVYLAGHSRGGALVMRLAQKFQQQFPQAVVIVHPFDAVPNKKEGELGAYSSSINNPEAGYPRNTDLFDNKGNWAWKSDMRSFYPDKRNLAVFNMAIGGKIFGLAQEVRAVTHQSASAEITDLGWYAQRWYDMPALGAAPEDAGGHNLIARSGTTVAAALAHVEDRLQVLTNNMAPLASVRVSSTYCTSGSLNCYSAGRVNDTNLDTRVGGPYSWTNSGAVGSSRLSLRWPELINTNYVEVFTSEGYPLQDFRIEYLDGSTWRTAHREIGNTGLHIRAPFANIQTRELRLVDMRGPARQAGYARINEIVVAGDWVTPPNQAPIARCQASPRSGFNPLTTRLSASGSRDRDGSIVSYHWNFGDGSSGSGFSINHTFYGSLSIDTHYTVRLTVTDNDGATASTTCGVSVSCMSGHDPDGPLIPDECY